jgi:predicted nucleotidyltransferase
MGSIIHTLDDIKTILERSRQNLRDRYMVDEIGVFGSVVRGEADSASDIDILVTFHGNVDYFDFLELEEHLSVLLGVPVDLVEKNSLKPHIGERILSEVVML